MQKRKRELLKYFLRSQDFFSISPEVSLTLIFPPPLLATCLYIQNIISNTQFTNFPSSLWSPKEKHPILASPCDDSHVHLWVLHVLFLLFQCLHLHFCYLVLSKKQTQRNIYQIQNVRKNNRISPQLQEIEHHHNFVALYVVSPFFTSFPFSLVVLLIGNLHL